MFPFFMEILEIIMRSLSFKTGYMEFPSILNAEAMYVVNRMVITEAIKIGIRIYLKTFLSLMFFIEWNFIKTST